MPFGTTSALQGPGHLPKTSPGLPLFSTFQFPPSLWETPGVPLYPSRPSLLSQAPPSLQAEPSAIQDTPLHLPEFFSVLHVLPPSRVPVLCESFTPSRALTETGSPPSGTPYNPLVPSSFWGAPPPSSRAPLPLTAPLLSRLSSLPSGDPSPLSEAPSVLQGHYQGHTLPT